MQRVHCIRIAPLLKVLTDATACYAVAKIPEDTQHQIYIYIYKMQKKILYSITKTSVPIFNIVFNVSNEKNPAIYKVVSIN